LTGKGRAVAIIVTEDVLSRRWDGDNPVLRFTITGTASDYEARLALLASPLCPAVYEGRVREEKPWLDPVWQDTVTGTGLWRAEVTYKPPSRLETPDPLGIGSLQLTFDTTGGTMRRTASLQTVGSYSAFQGGAPDFKGAIGVTRDGNVEGVDVPMPVFNLRAEKVWGPEDPPDFDLVYLLTRTVNDAAVTIADTTRPVSFTFQRGELLYRGGLLGASRGDGGLAMTYLFEASPNATDLSVGSRISGIEKEGWHHLWVYYGEEKDDDLHLTLLRPFHAYVERVLPYADFTGLGLFT
jgi:hypothetical protein